MPFFVSRLLIMMLLVVGAGESGASSQQRDRVDEILTRLETRTADLKDIRTAVRLVEDDQVNLTRRTKIGTIAFLMSKPNPRFLISFERTEVDGMLGKREWYLFDGRWLYEVSERLGQVTQREIVGPGETIDLFDLETTPFPLPFGQRKATILKNFEVTIAPSTSGDPPDTDHLVCTPRTGSRFYRKYDRLEFFVHRTLHLPMRIVVTKNDGFEKTTADFPGLADRSLNTGMTASDFQPPREWRDRYKWVIENGGTAVESPPRE